MWSTSLRHMNRLGFYDPVIAKLNKTVTVQDEVREICKFSEVEALYVKGNVPRDKVLIKNSDLKIPFFNLGKLNCLRFEGSYHFPEDEVRFFARWTPRAILDRDKCIQHGKKKACYIKGRPVCGCFNSEL